MVKDIDSIDLDDPYTGKIAEVMSNRTCKKILNVLSEKEMSEGDIAKMLGIPLNTVEYNLNKLLNVKLIQKSEKYFWSERGKKIPVYKLADKKIVISSKTSQKNYVPVLAVSFLFLIIAAVASVFIIQYFTPFEMKFPVFEIPEKTDEKVGLEHFES